MTPHFTLTELTRSAKAASLRINNTPDATSLARLQTLAELLERIRAQLGVPITITSAYRCRELNAAVGGRTSSDHMQGEAADFVAPAFGTPYEICRALAPHVSTLGIGQLILESVGGKSWVHVSTRQPIKAVNRVITITDAGTQAGIQVVA
jgi:zinc D-Ala-D-Ala carboxypeptidase